MFVYSWLICVRRLSSNGVDISGVKARRNHYDDIGVAFDDIAAALPTSPRRRFWGQHVNQPLTLGMLRALPKADLHCRFDGAASMTWLWTQMGDDPCGWLYANFDAASLGKLSRGIAERITDFATFQACMQRREHTYASNQIAKKVCRKLMQSESQLRGALRDVVQQALADRVVYMELVVRPQTHTKGELTTHDVVRVLADEARKIETEQGVVVKLVLYASLNSDDPIVVHNIASLCVELRDVVAGFGLFGDNELATESFPFFQSTFHMLKNESVNVVMYAVGPTSASSAIHDGGASRLSGCFELHRAPALLDYCARHGVPIELAPSTKMLTSTAKLEATIGGSLFRLLLDGGVNVTLCSFRHSLQPLTRCEQLLHVYQQNVPKPGTENDALYLFQLIANGFRHNFAPLALRRKLFDNFVSECETLFEQHNIRYWRSKKFYFP